MPEVGSRPYARLRSSEPSVTTIINVLDKPGLQWGASKEAALYAVYSHDDWYAMDQSTAVDRIRRQFKGVWDGRAAMGTLVHTVNEDWCAGRTANLGALVAGYKGWEKEQPQKMAEANQYVDGLAKFWDDWKPTDIRSEDILRTPGKYIGTRDIVATMRGERWLLDIKTTAEQNAEKGIYGDAWGLQLAAYRYAQEVITYELDDKKKPKVATVTDNEPVDRCGIIHLRGNGEYTLFEVDAGPGMYDAFLRLCDVLAWRKTVTDPKPVHYLGDADA